MIAPTRRGFLTGMLVLAAAPAIVRASSLMSVRPLPGQTAFLGGFSLADTKSEYAFITEYHLPAEDVNAIGFSNIQCFIDKCQSMRITNASEWRIDWRDA